MSRKRLTLAVVVALLACLGLAGTLAYAQGGGNYTAIQVQNLGDGPAAVVVTYIDPDGNVVAGATRSYDIPIGESVFVLASTNEGLPDNFIGSVVLYSDQPIATISNHANYAGTSNSQSAASFEGFVEGATDVYVPLLFKSFAAGWNSRFYVQNVSDTPAEVTVHFYKDDGSLAYTNTSAVADPIAVYASRVYEQETDGNITAPWRGSARIESDQPVAVVVEEYLGDHMLLAYNAIPVAELSTDLRMPHLWKGYGAGWYSNFSIMNAEDDPTNNPATVSILYSNDCTYTTVVTTSKQFLQIDEPDTCLPDGWIGSAQITSTNKLVGTVNHVLLGSKLISSYTAFPAAHASSQVELPLVWNNYGLGWYSSVAVQATSPTTVTITYATGEPALSTPIVTEQWIDTMGFFLQSTAGLPNHWIGGATITADEPVLAIVNEQMSPPPPGRDVLLTYRPFRAEP
ncbi:MAG TPA: hypothetical protein VM537_34530 [Anaerolineae bacterium]|nr:hypothetical protein [Anaerolineae bacterium]